MYGHVTLSEPRGKVRLMEQRDDQERPPRVSAHNRHYAAVGAADNDDAPDLLDAARYADPVSHSDEEDAEYYLQREWMLYLVADDRARLLQLPPRLVARLQRLTDLPLATLALRALEEYATRKEAEIAAFVPGSAPARAPVARPATVANPVPAQEVAELARLLCEKLKYVPATPPGRKP